MVFGAFILLNLARIREVGNQLPVGPTLFAPGLVDSHPFRGEKRNGWGTHSYGVVKIRKTRVCCSPKTLRMKWQRGIPIAMRVPSSSWNKQLLSLRRPFYRRLLLNGPTLQRCSLEEMGLEAKQ